MRGRSTHGHVCNIHRQMSFQRQETLESLVSYSQGQRPHSHSSTGIVFFFFLFLLHLSPLSSPPLAPGTHGPSLRVHFVSHSPLLLIYMGNIKEREPPHLFLLLSVA